MAEDFLASIIASNCLASSWHSHVSTKKLHHWLRKLSWQSF